MHKTVVAILVVAVALVIASSAFSRPSVTTLNGTVGPGFTISLKGATNLKAGTYKFKINDKSNIHNFALKGPVSKQLTGIGFVGTKTVTVKLKKGKYTYYCAPHASQMKGTFTVK
ncbi:MAG: hypothetical protein H0W87_08235 [Actinobacteria bacterium]|nr:hypothetical protein [Actinomycetota bacterium]